MVNATLTTALILSATLGAAEGTPRERTPAPAKAAEAVPVAAQPAGDAPATEPSPDCASTLPLLEAWARTQETGSSRIFVECAGHSRVRSVGDERFLSPDEAQRSCAASWCFWVHYEARSGSELKSSMHPPSEKGGRFWEHVNRVIFKRGPTGTWTLELDPSITFIDGYQFPTGPSGAP